MIKTRYIKNSELLESFEQKDKIKKTKRLAGNTLQIDLEDGTKIIRYYYTDIITIKDNEVSFRNGGHNTVTTKERINRFSPFRVRVYSKNYIWYVKGYEFYEGITFDLKGNLISEDITIDRKKWNKASREINKFTDLIDDMTEIPIPRAGDCWLCLMRNQNGDSIDKDSNHLVSHIREEYMHGSLILSSLLSAGYRENQMWLFFGEQSSIYTLSTKKERIKHFLKRYLKNRLLNREYYEKVAEITLPRKRKKILKHTLTPHMELRLEKGKTNIYIDGKHFHQCMFLLMQIPIKKAEETNDYDNIDDLSKKYGRDLERDDFTLSPEEEFIGHCSNLEAWVENNYNPDLLHSSIAIPLLKELCFVDKKVLSSLLYYLDERFEQNENVKRKMLLLRSFKKTIIEALEFHEEDDQCFEDSKFLQIIRLSKSLDDLKILSILK